MPTVLALLSRSFGALANNDTDWVADVKRWVLTGAAPAEGSPVGNDDDGSEIGYEAAHPALEARHWPDAVGITAAFTTGR